MKGINNESVSTNPTSSAPLKRLVSNFARFLRRRFQCRFGAHWTRVVDIGSEHNCPDCGKHFTAIKWPKPPERKNRASYLMLHTPEGEQRKIHICGESERFYRTTFGTFLKKTGKWIVDDRFYVTDC